MKKNKIKQIIADGKAVINGWLQIPHSFPSEVMAKIGWDSLTIDLQHGVVDYPNALQMYQAIFFFILRYLQLYYFYDY